MKLSIFYKPLLLLVVLVITLVSCKRTSKDESFLGPRVMVAPEDFSIQGDTLGFKFTNTGTKVNFLTGTSYFEAKFSSEVSWKVEIKSRANGAKKSLYGTSDALNMVSCPWNGESDSLMFSNGDTCDAKLSITGFLDSLNSPKLISKTFVITKSRFYEKVINGISNHTIVDFEVSPGLPGLTEPYFDKEDELRGAIFSSKNEYSERAHGKFSLYCSGNDINNNGYIGGFDLPSLIGLLGVVKETKPEDVYLNVFVKGFPNKINTGLTLILYELDSLNVSSPAAITAAKGIDVSLMKKLSYSTDKWIKQVNVDWVGWRLVSVKYSEFKKPNTNEGVYGCSGNCILEPHKIRGMAVGLDSYPNTGYQAEMAVDNFVITEGGPFKP